MAADAAKKKGPDAADQERSKFPHRIDVDAYGVKVRVITNDPDAVDKIAAALPDVLAGHYSVIGSSGEYDHTLRLVRNRSGRDTLYKNGKREYAAPRKEMIDLLCSNLRLTIAEHAVGYVFVHAGVVAWKGKAIVIPGTSYSGKTTLAGELAKLGALYFSDEYTVIDERGLVHPFAKPLSIRVKEGESQQVDHTVGSIGGKAGTRPVRIGLVVLTEYKKSVKTWKPEVVTTAQGMMGIIANTVSVRRNPEFVMTALKRAVEHSLFLKGNRGNATETARKIIEMCQTL